MFKVPTQQVKRIYKRKNKMTTNGLFFISKNIIVRKQNFQVTNTRYNARPIFIFYPQPSKSV